MRIWDALARDVESCRAWDQGRSMCIALGASKPCFKHGSVQSPRMSYLDQNMEMNAMGVWFAAVDVENVTWTLSMPGRVKPGQIDALPPTVVMRLSQGAETLCAQARLQRFDQQRILQICVAY